MERERIRRIRANKGSFSAWVCFRDGIPTEEAEFGLTASTKEKAEETTKPKMVGNLYDHGFTDGKKPKMEKVQWCGWPVKCQREAKFRIIDFGFQRPNIWEFCTEHTEIFGRSNKNIVRETIIR